MKAHFFTLVIFILLVAEGCYIYQPMTADVPLISRKNDSRLNIGVSIPPFLQVSYAHGLSNQIALHAHGCIIDREVNYSQFAVGYYKVKDTSSVFEFYTGFGVGQGEASRFRLLDISSTARGNYQLIYEQLNYGITKNNRRFESGFSLKAGYMTSTVYDRSFYKPVNPNIPLKIYHNQCILVEPMAFIKFGGKHLKFSFTYGITSLVKLPESEKVIPYCPAAFSMSVNYRFEKLQNL
ncbi:MAG: hypothetical protein R3A43_01840 [Bacteroidia bacterium]